MDAIHILELYFPWWTLFLDEDNVPRLTKTIVRGLPRLSSIFFLIFTFLTPMMHQVKKR
jgi:hypothetical protein